MPDRCRLPDSQQDARQMHRMGEGLLYVRRRCVICYYVSGVTKDLHSQYMSAEQYGWHVRVLRRVRILKFFRRLLAMAYYYRPLLALVIA